LVCTCFLSIEFNIQVPRKRQVLTKLGATEAKATNTNDGLERRGTVVHPPMCLPSQAMWPLQRIKHGRSILATCTG
jgi:hypothetical protein